MKSHIVPHLYTTDETKMCDVFTNKIYLIATNWTYPFGGGEEFMYDTMEWAHNLGMISYWITFSDSKNKHFDKFMSTKHKYGTILNIPGGFNTETLYKWVYILKPDIIHHQGMFRQQFFVTAERLNIPFLTGFHFWTGGIILNEITQNIEIIKNAHMHKIHPEFEQLIKTNKCNFYCASSFVQECFKLITNVHISDIICPASSFERYKIKNLDSFESKYVVIINIHKYKGGLILLHLLKKCLNIHFMCIKTEHNSDDLDNLIQTEINIRNTTNTASCVYMERTYDMNSIYSQAKIIICASIVDETYCRIVNEAMMNGIPILTTHRGNIHYLVGDITPILDPEDYDEWVKAVNNLYTNIDLYNDMSNKMLKKYEDISENKSKIQFETVIRKTLLKSNEYNIGILTPWCDQGLGIQSRNYYNIIKSSKLYNIAIFAFKSYNATTDNNLQKNKKEWDIDNIYYSSHIREDITDTEIIQFCEKYNIGKMIIPETCWFRIFQIAQLLKHLNIKTYAIPNIEIVRKDELYKHNYFYKILNNNYLCGRLLSNLDVPNIYIGYGIQDIVLKEKKYSDNIIKYLFIGGMNAFSRKQLINVCEGFIKAYENNQNIHITVCVQKMDGQHNLDKYTNYPGFTILQQHYTYKDIIELYYTHHISIQVSKHEGLGIGFYESVLTGTPVLTLNTPPHNEIILDTINGWHIQCYYKKMEDNDNALFDSAYFDINVFAQKILEISNIDKINHVIKNLKQNIDSHININIFKHRFLNALN